MKLGYQNFKNWTTNKNSRGFMTLVIVCFFVLTFIFSAFADPYNNWSVFKPIQTSTGLTDTINNATIRTIFSTFVLIILCFVFILGFKEIGNIIFNDNKKAIVTLILSNLVFYLIINITYISIGQFHLIKPDYELIANNVSEKFNKTANASIFAIVFLVAIIMVVFNIILNFILLKITKKINKKDILSLLGLWFFFNMGLYAIAFTLFSKGWTTFLYLSCLVVMTDSFAYIIGKRHGKLKMIPHLSPNKTWSGAIFGSLSTLVCMLGITLLYSIPIIQGLVNNSQTSTDQHNLIKNIFQVTFYTQDINMVIFWWFFATLAIFVFSIIAILGDLYFSYIKRLYQVKDYSNVLRGHGGILDRFDGFSFVFGGFLIYQFAISFAN
ncbi:phosphatidate cytidylyltransferase [Mycoplasma sp. E35C]|uniref:phosphatidate cytidylyltransferase n=1 Tax=Mycoplasma sp. E35C TaxID=2801918 RepID=UPI001CA42410|nr:phosphatidate cytidylyltransferase [Mycoplasma sp. E35C]QZX49224.1 phosphatidate cytidylyltransferase [Mycoplasma sp. E35C]